MKSPLSLRQVFNRLYDRFGPLKWWPADTPFEVCVGAILTQNTNWTNVAKAIANRAQGDAIVWFAYPKGTSKRYKSEINRDTGWQALGQAGFEPVRAVAIDEDWSALRFRRVEFIKTMTRAKEHRMTAQGKARSK